MDRGWISLRDPDPAPRWFGLGYCEVREGGCGTGTGTGTGIGIVVW